jgi:pimeloyl-ACP methyl ester carboxylesterase
MSPQTQTLDVRGMEITLHRAGRGEPVLYLHSASAEARSWPAALDPLAAQYDVVAPVHPGFPGSGGLERIADITDLVLHYVDLLDRLGWRRAHLVGSSLGGWIAAELAALYPERAASSVLAGAAGLWLDEAPMAEVFGVAPGQLAERLFFDQQHPVARMMHAAGETLWDVPPEEVLLAFYQASQATAKVAWNPYFHDPRLEGRLSRITAPTLVLWGAEDRFIPSAYGERYRERIAGAVLRTIPACGHLPVIEQPDTFAREVLGFLTAHRIDASIH